jgi:cytochrome oxidase assembly protein ShyY1
MTPKWLLCHLLVVVLVVAFLRLGWWQLSRAEGGNGLSIGYTLEWPAFAAFVIVVWIREMRNSRTESEQPDRAPAAVPGNDVVANARAERAARTQGQYKGVSTHE